MAAKKAAKEAKIEEKDTKEQVFTRDQILTSERYAGQKDLVGSLLKNDVEYDLKEVDTLIKEFMERKVN